MAYPSNGDVALSGLNGLYFAELGQVPMNAAVSTEEAHSEVLQCGPLGIADDRREYERAANFLAK